MFTFIYFISVIIYFPLIIAYLLSSNRHIVDEDVLAWEKWRPQYFRKNYSKICKVAILLFLRSEFRAQLMFRLGSWQRFILRPIVLGEANSCYIENGAHIGGGLVVLHGNGVVIGGGARIGRNCTIFQNTTIGNQNGFPEIGDNCFIGAGAIVIGPIKIGNNVKTGAGAIVVENVLDNCTVVCEKARIIKK